jgi:tRNA-specific 2-thiouridylase
MRVGFGGRRYVVRLDADTCDVVIGTHDDLTRSELTASSCHWLICPPQEPFRCQVKIRYRSPATWATVMPQEHNAEASQIHVVFDEPRHAIAPGQVAACYLGDRIIGGGWIE